MIVSQFNNDIGFFESKLEGVISLTDMFEHNNSFIGNTELSSNLKSNGAENPPDDGDMTELPYWVR